MLDIPGRQIATTFQVGGHPSFVVTGLYPLAISLTPQQSLFYNTLNTLSHFGAAIVIVLAAIIIIFVNRYNKRRSA